MTYTEVGRCRQSPRAAAIVAASQPSVSKKRQWRDGAFRFGNPRESMSFFSKYRSSVGSRMEIANLEKAHLQHYQHYYQHYYQQQQQQDQQDQQDQHSPTDATAMIMGDYEMAEEDDEQVPFENASIVQTLPQELMELVLSLLDGHSLLACSLVCRSMTPLTHDRNVWKNICMKQWPSLQTQFLPQLPGAPDYDVSVFF